jgi:hypothetical protein
MKTATIIFYTILLVAPVLTLIVVQILYCNKCPYKDNCNDIVKHGGFPPCLQNHDQYDPQ